MGEQMTMAECYLFVMPSWSVMLGGALPCG
jgi:hypothetical protein